MDGGICAGIACKEAAFRGYKESDPILYGTLSHRLMEASLQSVSKCSSALLV